MAIDHVPARRLACPCTPVATERDGSSKSPITPCTRQRPARAARFSLLSADNYCSAVHGAKRLPRPPPPSGAAERLAPLLNAGMSSAPCSLPAARGHGCRRDPSCCRHAVAGGGGPGRKGRWSWGAAELRRAAEADDQGGRRAKRRPGGGRYFKHRPPLGPCRPLDQAPASQIGCGLWSAARSYSSGGRGSAASLGLFGEAPNGGGGPRRSLRSSRDPFWAKASAGLRRRRPGGRQAAWTCRGACRLPCRRLRRRRSGWRHSKSRSSSRPARADVPGVVPSGCRGRLAARGSVRRGESARGAAEQRPGLGSVCFLFADASWWRCGLWGRREPGRRGRQQSSPHGARRSSGVRGWTGARRPGWTGVDGI